MTTLTPGCYVLVVTTSTEGKSFYSCTRGLVKEKWMADRFDTSEGADVAARLLNKTKARYNWFIQRKSWDQCPAEFPTFDPMS